MATPIKIRILLADDHELVRRGLRLVLESEPDIEVVAEAADGAEAFDRALRDDVDLVVLDISMPRLTGLQAVRRLREHRPELRTLILSMHDDERYLSQAFEAGASGYVLKSSEAKDLVEACRAAVRGQGFVHPGTSRTQFERARSADSAALLTPRETEVTKLIAEGCSGREIAVALQISEKTVERHRSNILEKLGARDRVAITRYAIRLGLIDA